MIKTIKKIKFISVVQAIFFANVEVGSRKASHQLYSKPIYDLDCRGNGMKLVLATAWHKLDNWLSNMFRLFCHQLQLF